MTDVVECVTHDCPECQAGKHGNCRGDAWCLITDDTVACSCWAGDHLSA